MLACAALAAALLAGCGSGGGSPAPGSTAANRAQARRDSALMITAVKLPRGAERVGHEPAADNGYLKAGSIIEADSARAVSNAWWIVPRMSSQAVYAYVLRHPPAHSTKNSTGTSGNSETGTSDLSVGFGLSTNAAVTYRELTVITTALPGRRTGVLVEAQSDWEVARARSEVVPPGVTRVTVTLVRPGAKPGAKHVGPTSRVVLTSKAAVSRAIKLVDSLGVDQPVFYGCPAMLGPEGSLRVAYSAGKGRPALALATVGISVDGWGGTGWGCDPIAFSIRGHTEKALVGNSFVREMLALARIPEQEPRTTASNRAAARRDMARMLAELRLPAGAVRVRHEPAGDNGYLRAGASSPGNAWWVVPDSSSDQVNAYITAHPPRGSVQNTHGSGGDLRTGTSSLMVGFSWPAVPRVLSYRELTVITTALPGGRVGVLAEAQSTWLVARSPDERVPGGVTAVEVTYRPAAKRPGIGHAGPTSHFVIVKPSAVRRAVQIVDQLEVAQSGLGSCVLEGGPTGYLDVRYSAGPRGPALAEARVVLFAGWGPHGGDQCDQINFSIRAHAQRPLVGTSFIAEILKLAGHSG